jgi:DNA-binding transcriptional LysR family regulator
MDFRHLRYFVAVAEHLNFRRAAEALHTSQPSLSQQIRALESELGIVLFERTKRSVRLTSAGKAYLTGVRELLSDADSCLDRAREAQAGLSGNLSICASGMVMIDHVPQVVRRFRADFPDVTLSLTIRRRLDIVRTLRSGVVDLAFATSVEGDDEMATQRLWSLPPCIVLSTDHPMARKRNVRLSELANETLLMLPRSRGGDAHLMALCSEQGFAPKSIREVSEIADFETLIGHVACGLGITILSSPFEKIAPPGVIFKPISPTKLALQVSACWRRREENPLVQNFLNRCLWSTDHDSHQAGIAT